MTPKELHPGLRAALEFGPIIGFVIAYIALRDQTFTLGGTAYTGLVAVTGLFLPVFVLSIGALWWLTGTLTRLQVAVTGLLIVFAGLSLWLNDPRLVKMKPTAVYLLLGTLLGVGLLLGKSWLSFVMGEIVPLKKRGWKILTARVTALCFVAAAANELVWRTQSEGLWLTFEAIVMPLVVLVFCLAQIPLYVEYATFKSSAKDPAQRQKRRRARAKAGKKVAR